MAFIPSSTGRQEHQASMQQAFSRPHGAHADRHAPLTEAQQHSKNETERVRDMLDHYSENSKLGVSTPRLPTRNISGKLGSIGYSFNLDFRKLARLSEVTFLRVLNDLSYQYYRQPLKALRGSTSLMTMLRDVTIVEVYDKNTLEGIQVLNWSDLNLVSENTPDGKYAIMIATPDVGREKGVRIIMGQVNPTHQRELEIDIEGSNHVHYYTY